MSIPGGCAALGINIIASAPENVDLLDDIVASFQRQADVARSLLSAERELRGTLSHSVKFNRIRPTLKFIHGPQSDEKVSRQRQLSLSALGHSSRSFCALSFTPHAILRLADDAFESLIKGIDKFVERKTLSELIESQIGHFFRRTLKDFVTDTPTPFLWVEDRPLKRRKTKPKPEQAMGDAEATGRGSRLPAELAGKGALQDDGGSSEGQGTTAATSAQRSPTVIGSSQTFRKAVAKSPQGNAEREAHHGRLATNERVEVPSHQGYESFTPVPLATVDSGAEMLSTHLPDDAPNDSRVGWFARGINLSDFDVLQHFQDEWSNTGEKTPTNGGADEPPWSGRAP